MHYYEGRSHWGNRAKAPDNFVELRWCSQPDNRVLTFCSEAAVDRLGEGIVRSASLGAALASPPIEIARHKFGTLIEADRCRQSDLSADLPPYFGPIFAGKFMV